MRHVTQRQIDKGYAWTDEDWAVLQRIRRRHPSTYHTEVFTENLVEDRYQAKKYNARIVELGASVNRSVVDLVSTRIKTQKGWPLHRDEII